MVAVSGRAKRRPAILPFGREDKSLLTPELLACLARVGDDDSVAELVKYLHFNPASAQNFNVFIEGERARVFDGTCWVARPLDITMFGIASGLASDIMTHLEANPASVTGEELDRFEEYYDTVKYERRDLLERVADVVRRYSAMAIPPPVRPRRPASSSSAAASKKVGASAVISGC
jgi:hypothetical protein